MERLGPDLGRKFLEIVDRASGQKEFEAELDKHPELREALGQASAESGLGDVPAEIIPVLQELAYLVRRADMPRRGELCQQALRELDREQNSVLWAALQNELANSLAQTPSGDRAENLERAIHHFSQALEVYTRQAALLGRNPAFCAQ
jgi:hypothetical protein